MTYSFDFKERIGKVLNEGKPLRTMARLLGISRSTLYRWKRKAADPGSSKPKKMIGRPPKIQNLDAFKEFVEKHPDKTLREMANVWGNVSLWSIYRTMKKIKYTYKKKLQI